MDNVIPAVFDPAFRLQVFNNIKYNGGPNYNVKMLIKAGYHPSFAKALVRNITRNMGW
jgi:hypothetical protein